MSASRRLTRSVSRSTARRSAVALGTAVGLTGVVLVAPASAGVPATVARAAASPFAAGQEKSQTPVTLDVSYKLDGKKISADQVAGRTGLLETTYVVRNRTTTPTELRYKDGTGQEVVETVDLVTPYVGRLTVALPGRVGDVTSDGAEIHDDAVAWSLVLFNPLGEPAQQLRFTAQVTDAELPVAELEVAKVTPTAKSVLGKGTAAAEEASGGSTRLTEGVFKIDSSVLKLRDGATQLLDGLIQLAEGAGKLNDGLEGKAAPGAQKLSDGLGKAREGGAKLDDGVGQLSAGATQLSAGLTSASTGGTALADGLDKLVAGGGRLVAGLDSAAAGGGRLAEGLRSTTGEPDLAGGTAALAAGLVKVRDGVAALTAVDGLPAAKDGLQKLLFGLDHAPGTLGEKDPGGLLQGLTAIAGGLSHPVGALGPDDRGGVKEGLAAVLDPKTGLPVALAGVTGSKNDLNEKLKPGGDLDRLVGGAVAVEAGADKALNLAGGLCTHALPTMPDAHPAKQTLAGGCAAFFAGEAPTGADRLRGGAAQVRQGVTDVKASTTTSRDNLIELEAGLTRAVGGLTLIKGGVDQLAAGSAGARDAVKTQVIPGVEQLIAGLGGAIGKIDGQLAPGVGQLTTGSQTLAEKTALAADGAAQLRGGLDQLAAGGGQLSDGAGAATAGSRKLADGLDQLEAGGVKLSDGLVSAKAGTSKLSGGLVQLDDGAAQLATGLGDAAEGSGKLEDGIIKVRDGVEKVRDGANELSGRGTSALGGSVNNAARANAQKVAMLQAIGELSSDSSTDPSFDVVLAGASTDEDGGISSAALLGGAAGLALLTMAAAGVLVARRRTVV